MNSFGRIFRISIFGESHGTAIGVVIDGVPPGIPVTLQDFESDLARRRSGLPGTTPRHEPDLPEIVSGCYNGFTTGSPLTVLFRNKEQRSADYDKLADLPRPGHADFTSRLKFKGFSDPRGGGHFSGRITLGLVAAGVIAKKILENVSVQAKILELGGRKDFETVIEEALSNGDSVGGLIECRASGIPAGWGEPFFDSVESVISHLIFSIPAIKGIEFGSGFKAAAMSGSQHNDPILDTSGKTATNNAGGINGGITNGNELVFRVAVKPTSSISLSQNTVNLKTGETQELKVEGRHDSCIALRIPVIIEAVTAIALADFCLLSK